LRYILNNQLLFKGPVSLNQKMYVYGHLLYDIYNYIHLLNSKACPELPINTPFHPK